MLMKLPEGVTSIHIGECGALEEVSAGIVDVPAEHVAEAKRHGLVESDFVPEEGGTDYAAKTKAELIAILQEKGVDIPSNANKATLLELIVKAEEGAQ